MWVAAYRGGTCCPPRKRNLAFFWMVLIRFACIAFLKQTSLEDPNSFQTTVEVFEQGLQTVGKDAQCVGYRPKVSDDPLKFADHYLWQTYGEVDTRRKNLGSAIQGLFNSGDALAADGLETIALWSMNIPGEWRLFNSRLVRI